MRLQVEAISEILKWAEGKVRKECLQEARKELGMLVKEIDNK